MKKFLLPLALTAPLWVLATCGLKTPEVPKPPQQVTQLVPADIWEPSVRQIPLKPSVAPVPTARPTTPTTRAPVRGHVLPKKPLPPVEQPAPEEPKYLPCPFPFFPCAEGNSFLCCQH